MKKIGATVLLCLILILGVGVTSGYTDMTDAVKTAGQHIKQK